jgi:hypothetical protein
VLGGATVTRETVPDEQRPAEAERAHAALRAAAAELEALAGGWAARRRRYPAPAC